MPILLVLLVLIFGSFAAASLPLAIGVTAILGAFTALRAFAAVHRRLDLRGQRRHDHRPGPGHRLRPVHGQPVPGGDPPAGRTSRRAGPHDGHRRADGRGLRRHGRDLAGRAADLPAGVPALDGLRRDERRADRDARRAHAAAGAARRCSARRSTRCRCGRGCAGCSAVRSRCGRTTAHGALVPDRAQRDAPAGGLRRRRHRAAGGAGAAVPAGAVRRHRRPGAARPTRRAGSSPRRSTATSRRAPTARSRRSSRCRTPSTSPAGGAALQSYVPDVAAVPGVDGRDGDRRGRRHRPGRRSPTTATRWTRRPATWCRRVRDVPAPDGARVLVGGQSATLADLLDEPGQPAALDGADGGGDDRSCCCSWRSARWCCRSRPWS